MLLLPTSYLPPVSWFSRLVNEEEVMLEYHEHFPKQTWRNRCSIYSPNGPQLLVVPLHERRDKSITKDIRISYDRDWQKLHWRSLEAAYRSSPFFEYYEDDFRGFYETRTELLVDLNLNLIQRILELLELETRISFSASYEKEPAGKTDERNILTKENVKRQMPRYLQVFENKHGFLPNLSMADLLFNLGPRSTDYLRELNVK